MALTLNSEQLDRYDELTARLVAPFSGEGVPEWGAELAARMAALFEAPVGICVLPVDGGPAVFEHGLDAGTAARLTEWFGGDGATRAPTEDPLLKRFVQRVAAAGMSAWTELTAEHVTRIPVTETRLHREVLVPAGVRHHAALAVRTTAGVAMLGAGYPEPGSDPYGGGDDSVELLHRLLNPFRAGLLGLERFRSRRHGLWNLLAGGPAGVAVLDADGRMLARNGRLESLLSGEPESEALLTAINELAVGELTNPAGWPSGEPGRRAPDAAAPPADAAHPAAELVLGHTRYTLTVSTLPAGTFTPQRCAVVVVAGGPPRPPDADELRARHPLSRRQSQVAALALRGSTNAAIATQLGLSEHTIRHHLEAAFAALGVHSRIELVHRLLDPGTA